MIELLLRSLWTFISTFVALCLLLALFVVALIEYEAVIQMVKWALGVFAAAFVVCCIYVVVQGLREAPKAGDILHQSSSKDNAGAGTGNKAGDDSASGARMTREHEDQESIDEMLDEFRRDFPEVDFGPASDYKIESKSSMSKSSSETVIIKNES